jgi:hypothetical protein
MLRSALIIAVGFLALIGFACVPVPVPEPRAAIAATSPPSRPGCDAGVFLSKASYLAVPFYPEKGAPLPPTSTLPNNPDYASTLEAAFNAAPPGFQQVLCSLDAVYVNGAVCGNWSDCMDEGSWGWRRTLDGGGVQRIVALSWWLWNYPLAYSSYETQLTRSVLPQSGVKYSDVALADDLSIAVLAALAHEIGHIRWFDWVNASPSGYCNGTFFTNSWRPPIHWPPGDATTGFWRDLLTRSERNHLRSIGDYLDIHAQPPQINAIDNVPAGSVTQQKMIYQLLMPAATSPWASLFAAMSPDEDFVETYKLKVLIDPMGPDPMMPRATRLTSATITVPNGLGSGIDGLANIIADILQNPSARPFLSWKLACIPSY